MELDLSSVDGWPVSQEQRSDNTYPVINWYRQYLT